MVEQIKDVAAMVEGSPDLKQQMQEDPAATLRTIGAMPLQSDPRVTRPIVWFLGLTALIGLVTDAALAFYGKTSPQNLGTLAATALGALAGVLNFRR